LIDDPAPSGTFDPQAMLVQRNGARNVTIEISSWPICDLQ